MSSAYEYTKAWRARPENKNKRAEEARRYRAKHPEKVKANAKRFRERHLEKIRESDKLNAREWRTKNREKQREREIRSRNNQEMRLSEIAGRDRPATCDICGESPPPLMSIGRWGEVTQVRIVFDHCHETGKFRGWICDRCNKVLGLVKDSSELLNSLAEYLRNFNEQHQAGSVPVRCAFTSCGSSGASDGKHHNEAAE